MKADYVYKNQDDTIRIRIHHQDLGWDYDVFHRYGDIENYSDEAGDIFKTKKDAKIEIEIESTYGIIKSMGSIETVTEGW